MEDLYKKITYWSNGQVKSIRHQNAIALSIGLCKDFYFNGVLEREFTYNSKGLLHGLYKTYHDIDKINQTAHYNDGILNGFFSVTNEDGSTFTKGHYKNNIKIGFWKEYGIKFKYYL